MKNIKSFNRFLVNESWDIRSSKEFKETLSKYKLEDLSEYQDYFYDLTDDDIATVKMSQDISIEESSIVVYIFISTKKFGNDISSLDKMKLESERLLKIHDCISQLISSVGETNTKVEITNQSSSIMIRINYKEIPKSEIDKIKNCQLGYPKEFTEGIGRLNRLYAVNGIDSPPLDINDSSGNNGIMIGYLAQDEIIVVANYWTNIKLFEIDEDEFYRSLTMEPYHD
jgi:hypothetical protein